MTTTPPHDVLADWLADFERYLRVANRAPGTVAVYLRSVRQLLDHAQACHPVAEPADVTRRDVEGWALAMAEAGRSEGTRRVRLIAASVFYSWLADEPGSGVQANPVRGVPRPTVPEVPRAMPALDDVRALLRACEGRTFVDLRDAAVLLVLIDCGLRRAEAASLDVPDVDTSAARILVRKGKGNRARLVAYGDRTALALSRYLRVRRRHPAAASAPLFVPTRPSADGSWRLSPGGVGLLLTRRCAMAGIDPPITPHQLRHLWAHSLAAAGVRETEMTVLGGWSPRSDMPRRYGAALAAERALAAHRANSPVDAL